MTTVITPSHPAQKTSRVVDSVGQFWMEITPSGGSILGGAQHLTSAELRGEDVQGNLMHRIRCQVDMGEENFLTVEVGTHDLIESAAHLLERKFQKQHGLDRHKVPANAFPYKAAESIFKFSAGYLDDDSILACVLASLQSHDVPMSFIQNIEICKECKDKGIPIRKAMEGQVLLQLRSNQNFLEGIYDGYKANFPVEEPIGDFVKSVVGIIKENLSRRMTDPLFEIDLAHIKIDELNAVLERCGRFFILQDRPGEIDQIKKDVIYSFKMNEGADEGWLAFYAAYDFLKIHAYKDSFTPSSSLKPPLKCPFYSTCDSSLRHDNPDICRSRPWDSEAWLGHQDGQYCPYALGMKQTRPDR